MVHFARLFVELQRLANSLFYIMHALFIFTQYLLVTQVLAALVGCITFNKWRHSYLKWFVGYLILISILVACGSLLVSFKKQNDFLIINQIAVAIEMLFISWFFYKTLPAKFRALPVAGAALYCATLAIEKYNFDNADYFFESLSYTVGNLFILVYIIIYFIDLVRSENILKFNQLTTFWIALGMLIFYLGTFPFYGLYNELTKNLAIFIPAAWVATSLNYIMYLMFTVGLIWGKPD